MPAYSLEDDLRRWGPGSAAPPPNLEEARAYCRRLARRHYENFIVASWLLPRELMPHFFSVYAYCRWADDLADETGDRLRALELLEWWEQCLNDCYRGRARHPVFVALTETIENFQIPETPFRDLLAAFRLDQRQTRWPTHDDLLAYCRKSANPVGRIVLHLGRCAMPENATLSDSVCTGLQLINFWQDIARDRDRGRIYVPQASWSKHGVSEEDFFAESAGEPFRNMLAEEVENAEQFLEAGRPLVGRVGSILASEVELFIEGGLAVGRAIRRQRFDVLRRRPRVSRWKQFGLLARAWWRQGR